MVQAVLLRSTHRKIWSTTAVEELLRGGSWGYRQRGRRRRLQLRNVLPLDAAEVVRRGGGAGGQWVLGGRCFATIVSIALWDGARAVPQSGSCGGGLGSAVADHQHALQLCRLGPATGQAGALCALLLSLFWGGGTWGGCACGCGRGRRGHGDGCLVGPLPGGQRGGGGSCAAGRRGRGRCGAVNCAFGEYRWGGHRSECLGAAVLTISQKDTKRSHTRRFKRIFRLQEIGRRQRREVRVQ